MGLRSWTKKQAKKAKKTAEKAGGAIEKTAKKAGKKAGDAIEGKAKKARKAIEDTAKDVGGAAEQVAKDVARKAEQALEDEIMNIFDKAKGLANAAKAEVEKLGKAAVREVEAAGKEALKEVEEGFTEKLPDLLEDAFEKLAEEASKEAAKKALEIACDVIETTAPDTYTLTFGVELALIVQGEVTVNLEIPNPVARLSQIREWAKHPPHGRAQIIECIKDFAPESLTVEAKVSGNGGSATYSGDAILDGVDRFLSKNGVD